MQCTISPLQWNASHGSQIPGHLCSCHKSECVLESIAVSLQILLMTNTDYMGETTSGKRPRWAKPKYKMWGKGDGGFPSLYPSHANQVLPSCQSRADLTHFLLFLSPIFALLSLSYVPHTPVAFPFCLCIPHICSFLFFLAYLTSFIPHVL